MHEIAFTKDELTHIFQSLIFIHTEFNHTGETCLCIEVQSKVMDKLLEEMD